METKLPTLRDVAKYAKVSVGAASDILNSRSRCFSGSEARKRVLDAVDKLNYRPNVFARSLRTNASGALGLVSHGLYNPYLVGTVEIMYVEARQRGLHILFESEQLGHSRQAMNVLSARWTDGLFLFWPYEQIELPDDPTLPPIVALDSKMVNVPRHPVVDRIEVDRAEGIYQATSYLIARGRRKIAIEVPPEHLGGAEKANGWRKAHLDAGLPDPDDSLLIRIFSTKDNDVLGGEGVAEKLLNISSRPDALVTLQDYVGVGAINKLIRNGVKVPDDVAVTGFNDSPVCNASQVPLASVAFPIEQMVGLALDMMEERTTSKNEDNKRQPGRLVTLKMEFKPRASCGGSVE